MPRPADALCGLPSLHVEQQAMKAAQLGHRQIRLVLGVAADPLAAGIVRVPASNLYRFVNAVISITVTLAMLWQVA
jgi:hypothetical protein